MWWYSGSSAHRRILLDDVGRLVGVGDVSLLQKLKVFVRKIEAQRSLISQQRIKVAAGSLVIGCTIGNGRPNLDFV